MASKLGVGCGVPVTVCVGVLVGVIDVRMADTVPGMSGVGVLVGVNVGVCVGVCVAVAVLVGVGVLVDVLVAVGTSAVSVSRRSALESVGIAAIVASKSAIAVALASGVSVAVAVGSVVAVGVMATVGVNVAVTVTLWPARMSMPSFDTKGR